MSDAVVDSLSEAQLAEALKTVLVVHRQRYRVHLYKRPFDSPRFKRAAEYECAIGAIGYRTPGGMWLIKRKALNPDWTVPDSKWATDAGLVPGTTFAGGSEANPIKAAFLEVWDGVGLHGTADLASLGHQASHGCIRMRPEDVKRLYQQVPVGSPVYVT